METIPNLDAMSIDELLAFAQEATAEELFPAKPRGYAGATKKLKAYAIDRRIAMLCRLDGQIQEALMYEHSADRIYDKLPAFAKF